MNRHSAKRKNQKENQRNNIIAEVAGIRRMAPIAQLFK